MQPYQQQPDQLSQTFKSNLNFGLTNVQYQKNLDQYGYNALTPTKLSSTFHIFCNQLADPLTYLLFGAAIIIFFTGQAIDAYIITGILIFNAFIGTLQEKRTEKTLDNLQFFFQCDSLVTRQGQQKIVSNNFIVPGDIIFVTAGEKIPADARIIHATNLTTDESTLTGESNSVAKSAAHIPENNLPITQQHNILFAGTYVLTGHATAIVFATGKHSQAGKIYEAVETLDTNTPLKQELETLSSWIFQFILVMCTLLFSIGLITNTPIIDLFVMLTALFICVIPEGLPVVLTIIFVTGAYKMAQQNILVKRLRAIETLGRLDVIITDKTGTLTCNEMMVTHVFVNNTSLPVSGSSYLINGSIENQSIHQATLDQVAIACALLNDTQIEYNEASQMFQIKGSPTQAAAFVFSQKVNPNIINNIKKFTINYKIPFDAQHKYAAIFCQINQQNTAFILGAPETIIPACTQNIIGIQQQLNQYLSQGYRVIAVAKKIGKPYHKDAHISDKERLYSYQEFIQTELEFLGLLAINDEPRANLQNTIQEINQTGIQIIMATGDHLQTALYIADKLDITHEVKDSVTGEDFERLNELEKIQLFHNKNFICARFSPQQKLQLVQLFRTQGKIVATTGDGINDVPALVASDVSIAMGKSGTQLVKQSADIILLNDNLENILYAMHQGKAMFYALRRTILYFLISNATEVFIIFFALCINIPMPLLPSQILLLNLMTDGLLDAALAMEPALPTQLKLNHKQNQKIFNTPMIYKTLYLSLPASIISFIIFLLHYQTDLAYARTLTFITLIAFQWFNALNCRSETKSIFNIGIFSNFWFLIASILIFILQAFIVYMPIMQYIFKTTSLNLFDWSYAIIAASTILIIEEIRKYTKQSLFLSSN